MVRPVRLELTAPRLKGGCSTTELRAQNISTGLIWFGLNPTLILYQKFYSCAIFFAPHLMCFLST